ncbi:nucleotidyltransferase domain-containing protein [Halonotius roseus]|nr:nucleotidyltransferase domain-containing protein [Halonotius roseus]
MARQMQSGDRSDQATIGLPIPPPEPDLFRHGATTDVLRVLVDNPYKQFTVRELGRLTDNAAQSVKRAVDVLEPNGLIVATPEGNRRLISINRTRVSIPDDPILRIPQPEFQQPVRTAIKQLQAEIESTAGMLLFGSVAHGDADRQSDIDLWMLATERGVQHTANEIAKELGQQQFDGDRYEFQILVETPDSARSQADRLRDIFTDAITLVENEELTSLKQEVLNSG